MRRTRRDAAYVQQTRRVIAAERALDDLLTRIRENRGRRVTVFQTKGITEDVNRLVDESSDQARESEAAKTCYVAAQMAGKALYSAGKALEIGRNTGVFSWKQDEMTTDLEFAVKRLFRDCVDK